MADFRQTLARLSPEERHRLKLYAQAVAGLRMAAWQAEDDHDYAGAAYWRHRAWDIRQAGRALWAEAKRRSAMEVRNG